MARHSTQHLAFVEPRLATDQLVSTVPLQSAGAPSEMPVLTLVGRHPTLLIVLVGQHPATLSPEGTASNLPIFVTQKSWMLAQRPTAHLSAPFLPASVEVQHVLSPQVCCVLQTLALDRAERGQRGRGATEHVCPESVEIMWQENLTLLISLRANSLQRF